VEINSSFYHIPLDTTLIKWYQSTPASFVFALKGYKFITHLKKMRIDQSLLEILSEFQRKAHLLKEKLGCILWQLPANQKLDLVKLESFCDILDTSIPHIFEFRDKSWFIPEVFQILKSYRFTLCMISAPDDLPEIVISTSDIAYLRFHGKNGWYDDNYSEEQLELWVEKISKLRVKELFVYFNNDFQGFAINNASYFSKVIHRD
jgi:uncharacterized protein YecE (DUF72 family)